MPPFSGCLVCVTGLSLSTRNTVRQLVTDGGGVYTSDLTRDCSHLVAAARDVTAGDAAGQNLLLAFATGAAWVLLAYAWLASVLLANHWFM